MNPRTTTPRTKIRSRALAVTTATLVALGGGAVAVSSSAADIVPPPQPGPVEPGRSPEEATQLAVDLTPDLPNFGPWTPFGADTSDYDQNQSLSAITINVSGATGSTPRQVALFAGSKYIGTTTPEAYPYQTTERVSDNIIKVNYRYLLPGDSNAAPSGEATSYYILQPQGLDRVGSLPPNGAVPPA
ncbi:MAG TPA: LppP/LprE family lipoprotein [Candidatus Corynebacterium avicola]|uniref:LppP/LprE family lipoprotein n=1 Tax=Candidatus Corynebacterium avicola TaxID=2838527 RepID=A0A9D1RMK9_9CORY|nr:LppP/LprE family lipoprotein [Candidatus Corynebacterium avicola]